MLRYFLASLFACQCIAGLSAAPANSDADTDAVATACNQFSFDLLGQVQKPGENVFFSSYSICTALAMVLLGAGGNTAKQLQNTFHYDANLDINPVYQKLISAYNDPNSEYTLSTANRLYGADDFKLNQTFQDNVKKFYLAELEQVDFSSGAEDKINQWVAQQTHDKIKELFPPGSLDSDTKLVLANAIYFKGSWVKQFDSKLTQKEKFTISAGNDKQVDMMNIEKERFPYQEDTDLDAKVLQMPYSGDKLSMLIVLPNNVDGLSDVTKKLTAEKIKTLMDADAQDVEIKFPKFKLETEYDLVDTLKSLKCTDLFTDSADLSGISIVPLRVSQVKHKAFVQVDEEGTEAAAATGVAVEADAIEVTPTFFADHPFFFAIVDKTSQVILFSGVLGDPTK